MKHETDPRDFMGVSSNTVEGGRGLVAALGPQLTLAFFKGPNHF